MALGAFKQQTGPMVVGSAEKSMCTGATDLFFSKDIVSLRDDTGVLAAEPDFTDDFYGSLIRCLTSVSDWYLIFNQVCYMARSYVCVATM